MRLKLTAKTELGNNINIFLPTSEIEIDNFIEKLPNQDPVQGYTVEDLEDVYMNYTEYFKNIGKSNLLEWNLLAIDLQKVTGFDEYSLDCLFGTNIKENTVAELINLTRNTINETYIFECSNYETELFYNFIYNDLIKEIIPSLEDMSYDELRALDPQKYGEKIVELQNGQFYGNFYIATDNLLQNLYESEFDIEYNNEIQSPNM